MMQRALLFILFFTCSFQASAQEGKKPVQLHGIIVSNDSLIQLLKLFNPMIYISPVCSSLPCGSSSAISISISIWESVGWFFLGSALINLL